MKKIYLPFIALIAGFANAFLAAGVHSLFFTLVPILAFVFGYFSSWRWGLLCGFLLFAGYTFGISVVWQGFGNPNLFYPLPYIASFIVGGFSIILIGALAPWGRKGLRKPDSIIALAIAVIVAGLCVYWALPHYGYYYQVTIQSQENLENLELYLPVGTLSGKPYEELYNQGSNMPGHLRGLLTGNFTWEIVETEYGKMLKITIANLETTGVPMPRYHANIIFWEKRAPRKLILLAPKNNIERLNTTAWQEMVGPVKSSESLIAKRFEIPVKIISSTPGQVSLSLENRTDRSESVNFAYSKSYPYTEHGRYDMQTGNEWAFFPIEAKVFMEIRGISD